MAEVHNSDVNRQYLKNALILGVLLVEGERVLLDAFGIRGSELLRVGLND